MSNLLYDPVKTHSKITDEVIVGFSGGKDSIVTLDLCCQYFKRVEAYFMYTVPNLEFQERSLRFYEHKYNIEITRLPHPDLSLFMHYGLYRPIDYSVPVLKHNDIYDFMREKTGIAWVAAGERINDSIVRRAMIKHSGTADFVRKHFYTVAHWTQKEIFDYIKIKKLQPPVDKNITGKSLTGVRGEQLYLMRKHFPKDYEKFVKYFPYAKTIVKRYEMYGK